MAPGETVEMRTTFPMRPVWRWILTTWFAALQFGSSAAVIRLVDGSWAAGLVVGAVTAPLTGLLVHAMGTRYRLSVEEHGLEVRFSWWRSRPGGPGYRFAAAWHELGSLQRRRCGRMVPIDSLDLGEGVELSAPDGGPPDELMRRIQERQGTNRRTDLSLYAADWGDGPVGEALRRHRPDLLGH